MGGVGIDWHINYTKSYADIVGKDQFFYLDTSSGTTEARPARPLYNHYIIKDLPQEKYLSTRKRFPCLHTPKKNTRGVGGTARQLCKPETDLNNCLEFSRPLECLDQAM